MKFDQWLRHIRIVVKTTAYRIYLWIKNHDELMNYAFFGVLTTVVDWATSFALYRFVNYHIANIVAWVAAVVFAFFTNREWVFHSKKKGAGAIVGEFIAFAGGRVLSLSVQEMLFIVAVDLLSMDEYFVKIPVAVLVVVINFLISKYVFADTTKGTENKREKDTSPTASVKGRSILINDDPDREHGKEGNDNEA